MGHRRTSSVDVSTITALFWQNVDRYADRPSLGYKDNGTWRLITFREAGEQVQAVARGLAALDVTAGDKVSILSENTPRWAFADYAILSLSAVNVPVYATLIPRQIQYLLTDGEVKVIFVEDRTQAEKVLSVFGDLDRLTHIIVMNNEEGFSQDYVLTWDELIDQGKQAFTEHGFDLASRWNDLKPDDLLTIIYTSGTTGEPKGVMLTHGNMVSNINGGLERLIVGPEDRFLSFLPLSHSFERMAGHFLAYAAGATIYYAESIETVPENMVEVHPTVMTSIPRLYEKMYMRVNETVEQGSAFRKKIFRWAFRVGREYHQKQRKGNLTASLKARYALAHKLVFTKLHDRVGGALRFFVSGGAPLAPDIARFFESAGILILEGYGLTETSPVIAVNPLETYKIGTVGPPLYNVEVKIAADGEILTRGPHVMKGYFKKDAATREAIDEDNWMHTGDIGMLDEENYLSVTDRKKNLIVTSGGKNVAPQPIEGALINSPFIEQILLIGDKRKFISALVVPNFDNLKDWANKHNLYYDTQEELIRLPEVEDLIREEIDQRNQDFARYEQVKKFKLLPREFTIGEGELTPTLKIKRKVVEEEHRDLIDSMYQES